ncbi:hypothetical protein Tco_0008290 [Tanacetum coccineum]
MSDLDVAGYNICTGKITAKIANIEEDDRDDESIDDGSDEMQRRAISSCEPQLLFFSDQDPYLAYRVTARMSIRPQAPAPFLSEEVAERVAVPYYSSPGTRSGRVRQLGRPFHRTHALMLEEEARVISCLLVPVEGMIAIRPSETEKFVEAIKASEEPQDSQDDELRDSRDLLRSCRARATEEAVAFLGWVSCSTVQLMATRRKAHEVNPDATPTQSQTLILPLRITVPTPGHDRRRFSLQGHRRSGRLTSGLKGWKRVELTCWTVTNDVAYAMDVDELALLCDRMFPEETDKIERYVGGMADLIYSSVVASKPKTMQEAIEMATELMDRRINTFAERQEKQEAV